MGVWVCSCVFGFAGAWVYFGCVGVRVCFSYVGAFWASIKSGFLNLLYLFTKKETNKSKASKASKASRRKRRKLSPKFHLYRNSDLKCFKKSDFSTSIEVLII